MGCYILYILHTTCVLWFYYHFTLFCKRESHLFDISGSQIYRASERSLPSEGCHRCVGEKQYYSKGAPLLEIETNCKYNCG